MKSKLTILPILLLIFTSKLFACECPEYELDELDSISYELSDLVITGNVIKTGTNYQIEVIEVLKGKVHEKIIYGTTISEDGQINSCSFYPKDKGKYLLYLNCVSKNGKRYYEYSQCSGTRKLDFSTAIFSLRTDKSKIELISETEKWIDKLRKRKK